MYSVEIRNENTSHRAILCTLAAACAETVINSRKVIFDFDSAALAGLFAFLTADAGICAFLSCRRTLFLIATGNEHALYVCHKVYQLLRTGANANSTAYALTGVDMRYAVLEAYSVLRTDLDTVAKTYTSKGTFTVSAVHRLCRFTALNTDVIHLVRCMIAVAIAMHYRNLLDNVLKLYSEYLGDSLCGGVCSGDTKVCLYSILALILGKSLCVSVASRISARSAVSTGETFADTLFSFILRNSKELCRKHEHYSAEKSDCRDY